MDITGSGSAEPISFLTKWAVDFSTEMLDVTAMGDTNKVYAADLPDAKGTYNGWYDDATAQLYTASQDGVARKFYLYPSNAATSKYFFGTGFFDFSVQGGVGEAVAINGNWSAASSVIKVG